ncbi:MAG: phosphomannomutase [Desulfovibrio sp.]|jgi:phosphomannomutase|nr:phosphomannomutase [Desulfovibrio sp.]
MADELACFKAYDIRGRVPSELNPDLARRIGLAFAAEFAPDRVCVGYDIRLSSRDLALALQEGLVRGGAHSVDIGLCGTEEVYHATFSQGFGGGIMVTASHNPADWNGMKMVLAGAAPLNGDSGLMTLRDRVARGDLPQSGRRGQRRKASFRAGYIALLLSLLGAGGAKALRPLRIVANAGNGCAGPVLREIAAPLPGTVIPLYDQPDGTFPNGVPNPLLPENRAATREAVLRHKADLGLAFDGDFDRCFFFDEQGCFVESYYLIGLLAADLLADHPGGSILHDPRLVWNTREVVEEAGGTAVEDRTGHAFMKARMRRDNLLYGGEMSGHHYFRDFSWCDSGMLVWLLLWRLMSRADTTLSELVAARMRRYPVSGEINRSVADAQAVLDRVEARYGPKALSVGHIDGLSVDMGDWRFNMRASNTEPLLRLNVESRGDTALMAAKRDELLGWMV